MPIAKVMRPDIGGPRRLGVFDAPAAKCRCIRRHGVSPVRCNATSAKECAKGRLATVGRGCRHLLMGFDREGAFLGELWPNRARRLLAGGHTVFAASGSRSVYATGFGDLFLRSARMQQRTDPPDDVGTPAMPPEPAALGRLLSPKRNRHTDPRHAQASSPAILESGSHRCRCHVSSYRFASRAAPRGSFFGFPGCDSAWLRPACARVAEEHAHSRDQPLSVCFAGLAGRPPKVLAPSFQCLGSL